MIKLDPEAFKKIEKQIIEDEKFLKDQGWTLTKKLNAFQTFDLVFAHPDSPDTYQYEHEAVFGAESLLLKKKNWKRVTITVHMPYFKGKRNIEERCYFISPYSGKLNHWFEAVGHERYEINSELEINMCEMTKQLRKIIPNPVEEKNYKVYFYRDKNSDINCYHIEDEKK